MSYFIDFILLRKRDKLVTGGHKYDRMLFDVCNKIPGVIAKETVVGAAQSQPKYLWPFIEFFNGIKKTQGNMLIFNSASCLRLLPLMFYLKIFRKQKKFTIHHHFIFLEFKGLKRFVYKTAESLFLKLSDKIIVPSPYIFSELNKTRKEDDLLLWRIPFETKQEFPPHPKTGNLTFTGTIEPRKGLIYLLQALKRLQDNHVGYKLNIVGKVINENYNKKLIDYIQQNNLNVEFKGFVELEEKNRILSETDIFVFPSLLEGFGMVLVEAQVYGLPIVSFDNSAMPFTVKNGINGFAVPTFDISSMANRIEEIIKNRDLRHRLSQGALENVKQQWSYKKFEETVTDYFINRIGV